MGVAILSTLSLSVTIRWRTTKSKVTLRLHFTWRWRHGISQSSQVTTSESFYSFTELPKKLRRHRNNRKSWETDSSASWQVKWSFSSIRTSWCLRWAILHLQNFSISCKSEALSRLFRLGSISCKQRVHVRLISLSFHWHSSPVYHVDVTQQSAKVKLPPNFEYLPLLKRPMSKPFHPQTSKISPKMFTRRR